MMDFKIADLFCGAGGTSTGAIEAAEALGKNVHLTAVNHWSVAIATHTKNHPSMRHLCTGIDDINPKHLFKEGELDLLWASPECTHHSVARGGKPINDQSRSTAWCVTRWAADLMPPVILIENVPEFASWGPLKRVRRDTEVQVPKLSYKDWRHQMMAGGITSRRELTRKVWHSTVQTEARTIQKLVWMADPKKKGEIFQAWLNTLKAIGYKVDYRLFCAADYGDPTTRTRLFVQAVRGRRRIVWPNPTHSKEPDLITSRRWTPARDIIDWDQPSTSIYERKKPLSPKTMARIQAGLQKFGIKGFIVPQFGERSGQAPRCHDLSTPLPAVTSHGAGALVEPFLVTVANGGEDQYRSRSIGDPIPTVTAGGCRFGIVEPYIVAWDHQSGTGTWSSNAPLSTVTTKARHGVAEPFLIELRGTSASHIEGTAHDLEQPLGTVTASGTHHGLVEPFLVNMKGQSDAASVDQPAPTVTAHAPHLYVAEPFLVKTANGISRAGEETRAKSLSAPLPTVTCSGDMALVEPFLIQVAHGASASGEANRAKSLDCPLPTVCGNRGDMALIEPFIMSAGGPECPARPVSQPVGTVLTRDHRAIVIPHLLPQQSDGALRPVDQPVPTVATAGAIALVEPFLVSFYGTGQALSLGEPAPTVTTKDRFGLVRPIVEIDGARYQLDIRFRMLQPHELAAAQGFRKDYQFVGTKTDAVKQIGNAVPRRLARALVYAAVSQNADVSCLVDAEESEKEAAA